MHKRIAVLGWLFVACSSSAVPAVPGVADVPDVLADAATDIPPADTPPIPCDASCADIEKCNVYTGKCINLCGDFCTPSEFCQVTAGKGMCVDKPKPDADAGADAFVGTCTLPSGWSPNLQRISKLAIADVTKGCDLDGDGKPNNVLGKVVSLYKDANTQIQKTIDDGKLSLLLEAPGYRTDGAAFFVSVLSGQFDPAAVCEPGQADCAVLLQPDAYDLAFPATVECPAVGNWPEAKVLAGAFQAIGKGKAFPFLFFGAPAMQTLWIRSVIVTGSVTDAAGWQTTTEGLLCGGIAVADLEAATGGSAGPFKPDMALTPGGPKDAMSIALTFETVRAKASGLAK